MNDEFHRNEGPPRTGAVRIPPTAVGGSFRPFLRKSVLRTNRAKRAGGTVEESRLIVANTRCVFDNHTKPPARFARDIIVRNAL
jgi:hypothetical protein